MLSSRWCSRPPRAGRRQASRARAPRASSSTACLNDTLVGAAPACPAAGCTAQCTTIAANLKKGVGADAVKNLTAAICTANGADTTVNASLAKACADPTAKAFCDALVTGGCADPAFPAQCLTLANGLAGTGTGAMATLGRKALFDCINNDPVRDCTSCRAFVKGKP